MELVLQNLEGVVVILALYLMGDWLLGGLLGFIGQLGVDWAPVVKEALPGTALQAWKDWDVGFESKRVGALVVWTALTWVLTTLRVESMDVP